MIYPKVQQTSAVAIPIIVSVFISFYVWCAWKYWKVREREPAKSRRPLLVLAHTFFTVIFVCYRAITREVRVQASCGQSIAAEEFLLAVANIIFVARFLLLFLDFAVNQESLKFVDQQRSVWKTQLLNKRSKQGIPLITNLLRNKKKDEIELSTKSKDGMLKSELLKTREGVVVQASTPEDDPKVPLWFKLKHWLTKPKYLTVAIIMAILVEMLPVAVAINSVPGINSLTRDDPQCQELLFKNSEAVLVVQFFQLAFLLWMFFKMRTTVQENLGIKDEISKIAITSAVMFALEFINLAGQDIILQSVANAIGVNCWEVFALVLPASYLIYVSLFSISRLTQAWNSAIQDDGGGTQLRHSQKEVRDEAEELTACLINPDSFQAFLKFLALVFAADKAQFWKEVEVYREGECLFEDVYETFFSERSLFTIQVSPAALLKIEQHNEFRRAALEADQVPPEDNTIYDDAQTEVFRQLFEHFRRFKSAGNVIFINSTSSNE